MHIVKKIAVLLLTLSSPGYANGIGENISWQFQTSADRVNKAYIEDMRNKKRGGYYSPPNLITNIDKQFNCSITSSATGNLGSHSLSNSGPSASGNFATAKGNESATDVQKRTNGDNSTGITTANKKPAVGRYWNGFEWVSNSTSASVNGVSADVLQNQSNLGDVSAKASGDVRSTMGDSENYQALNSVQENTGSQYSNINDSHACSFSLVE